jgi:phage shock protein C
MTDLEIKPQEEEKKSEYKTAAQSPPRTYYHYHTKRKLYRSTRDKWVAGVCGGLAEHFDVDPVIVRLLWIVVTVLSAGIGIIAYLALWVFVDKYPSYYPPSTGYTQVNAPSYYTPPAQYPQANAPTAQYAPRAVHYHHYMGQDGKWNSNTTRR